MESCVRRGLLAVGYREHSLSDHRWYSGIGAALLVPAASRSSASFDEKNRGQAIGHGLVAAITTAIGPVLGGWLVQHASWRWAFLINLPLAAAVIAISFWSIPESAPTGKQRIDWIGALLATLGLPGLVTGFLEFGNLGWKHLLIIRSLIVAYATLVAFIFMETQVPSPMMPLNLFKSRRFSGANLLTLFLYAAIGIFFFLFPLNLIQVQGYSATATGAALLPFILIMFLLSRWSGGLVAHYGARTPLIIGPTVAALGFLLFAVPSVGGSYWKMFFPAVVVMGIGMAVTVAPLTTVVMSSVHQDRVVTASGVNNAVERVAGVLAVAVFGLVMVIAFGSRLNQSLAHLSLPPDVLQTLREGAIKLAGLQVPAGLDPNTRAAVQQSIGEAFVYGFRIVVLTCAGFSLASAAVAWFMIPNDSTHPELASAG